MQLNDILEENSVKAISTKTKISEDNLENLLAKNFDKLKRVKTLGFISIIEREYHADLANLREEAQTYYRELGEDKSITLGVPVTEEKKDSSKIFIIIIFALLAAATWYFLTQFDKKHLSELIPFVNDATLENIMENDDAVDGVEDLKISKVSEAKTTSQEIVEAISTVGTTTVMPNTKSETITDDESVMVAQTVTDISPETREAEVPTKKVVFIVPVRRLWFGLIDIDTKERNHFSIDDTYELEVGRKRWLIATSSAPFSLETEENKEMFNDAKEHYFKIDEKSVTSLTKSEYVALGGWAQW